MHKVSRVGNKFLAAPTFLLHLVSTSFQFNNSFLYFVLSLSIFQLPISQTLDRFCNKLAPVFCFLCLCHFSLSKCAPASDELNANTDAKTNFFQSLISVNSAELACAENMMIQQRGPMTCLSKNNNSVAAATTVCHCCTAKIQFANQSVLKVLYALSFFPFSQFKAEAGRTRGRMVKFKKRNSCRNAKKKTKKWIIWPTTFQSNCVGGQCSFSVLCPKEMRLITRTETHCTDNREDECFMCAISLKSKNKKRGRWRP